MNDLKIIFSFLVLIAEDFVSKESSLQSKNNTRRVSSELNDIWTALNIWQKTIETTDGDESDFLYLLSRYSFLEVFFNEFEKK